MKNCLRVKGGEFRGFSSELFKTKWQINDVPFSMRENSICDFVNEGKFPLTCDCSEQKLIFLDKLALIATSVEAVNEDILKNLTFIINPSIKNTNQVADLIIIRYNKIMIVQFYYNLVTLTKYNDLQESKVVFVLRQLEQTLKRYLPVDSVVKSYLFPIRTDKFNQVEAKRLALQIEEFYGKSTTKELLKLIQ